MIRFFLVGALQGYTNNVQYANNMQYVFCRNINAILNH